MNQQMQGAGGANLPPNSLAIVGFIMAFVCGIVGLILSMKARGQIKASGGTQGGWGFTTAGIIISIVGLVIGVIYSIMMALQFAMYM